MTNDTAFQMAASNIRFGAGITREIGMDLQDLQVKRTLVVLDPQLASLPAGTTTLESLKAANINFDVFDEVSVEPTDVSFRRAAEIACEGKYDSFVAVGGGSTIDTAKAANLYATY
ncbi:MAG: iron-containing alcohol dehydrogenase, partial [Planctomycetaceae bacterium]|nr:iron-containing alcohol dehydrogenase [Planctomycetaceae bacterium]